MPRDRACVYMSNHQSNLDIPILYSVFPGTLRMVAKAELFKVPLWGRAMREAGFVRVTRSGDRAEAMAAMRECGEAIARGVNVWIAPEGTRSLDGKVAQVQEGRLHPGARRGGRHRPRRHRRQPRTCSPRIPGSSSAGRACGCRSAPPSPSADRELNAVIAEVRQFIVAHVTEPED